MHIHHATLHIWHKNRKTSDNILPVMKIPDTELDIGYPPVIVLNNGIADIDRIAGFDMLEMLRLVESDGGDMVIWLSLLDQLKFQMAGISSHLTSVTVVIYILSHEYRGVVTRTERLELFEDPEKLRRDLLEVKPGINSDHRDQHRRGYLLPDK